MLKADLDHKAIKAIIKDFTCGYCHAQQGYDVVYAGFDLDKYYVGGRAFAILKCPSCKRLNLIIFDVVTDELPQPCGAGPHTSMEEIEEAEKEFLAEHPETVSVTCDENDVIWRAFLSNPFQYPHGYKFSESIPPLIEGDLVEAGNCLAVRASNAAAVMCRRVVERVAEHLGVPRRRNLEQTLNKLEELGVDKAIVDALRAIKEWGNVGAHSGKDEDVDLPHAREIFNLVITLVEYVFSHDLIKIKNMTDKLAEEHKRRKTRGITTS